MFLCFKRTATSPLVQHCCHCMVEHALASGPSLPTRRHRPLSGHPSHIARRYCSPQATDLPNSELPAGLVIVSPAWWRPGVAGAGQLLPAGWRAPHVNRASHAQLQHIRPHRAVRRQYARLGSARLSQLQLWAGDVRSLRHLLRAIRLALRCGRGGMLLPIRQPGFQRPRRRRSSSSSRAKEVAVSGASDGKSKLLGCR